MKKLLILLLCLCLSGCVPAIVVGAVAGNAASKKNKRLFIEEFNKQNLEREKAGLELLDFCTEATRMNAKWTKKLDECKAENKE